MPNRERSSRTFQIKLRNGGNPMPPATNSRVLAACRFHVESIAEGTAYPHLLAIPKPMQRIGQLPGAPDRGFQCVRPSRARGDAKWSLSVAKHGQLKELPGRKWKSPPFFKLRKRNENVLVSVVSSETPTRRAISGRNASFMPIPLPDCTDDRGQVAAPRHTLMHRPQPTHPTMASRW